jgi:hypothetical protein
VLVRADLDDLSGSVMLAAVDLDLIALVDVGTGERLPPGVDE